MNEILFADRIQIVIAACTFFAVVIAFYSMRIQHRDKHKEIFSKEAIQCLERAYGYLMPEASTGQPSIERLAWLCAARQLRAFEVLKREVEQAGYLEQKAFMDVCNANEDYWRICFYETITPEFMNTVSIGFIQPHLPDGRIDSHTLEPLSVAIVLGYCGIEKAKSHNSSQIDVDERVAAFPAGFQSLQQKFESKLQTLRDLESVH